MISIVVPAFNEEGNIQLLVEDICRVMFTTGKDFELIVVDDNSNDATGILLDKLSERITELRVFHRTSDRGVGNTIRLGLEKAEGDVVVTMDGDLSHDPGEIPKLLDALEGYDVVCGSRYIRSGNADMRFSRVFISRGFNLIFGMLLGLHVRDFTSGFRAFRRDVLKALRLQSHGFGIYVEILFQAYLNDFRIKEVPIHYFARRGGKSKLGYLKQGPEYMKVSLRTIIEKIKKSLRHI